MPFNITPTYNNRYMVNYISKEGERHIREFTYKGKDLSITYEYLWSPLADQMLRITPANIAPNTLTVAGFLINLIGTLVLCLQVPFKQPAPAWSLVLYASCVFGYQMLDNLDGKQARKIQNSTPLGMIMDHGCDALGVVALGAGITRIICVDYAPLFLWSYVFMVISFYMSAWVLYHSNGIMILGRFNGVDEGIPVIWIAALVSAAFGQQFWTAPLNLLGHTVIANELMAYTFIFCGFVQIYSVIAEAGQEFTKEVGQASKDLRHLVLILGTMGLITGYSDLAEKHVVGVTLGLAFTMARTISYTLVCSVTKMKFQQFQPSLLVFTLSYAGYVLFLQGVVAPVFLVYAVMCFTGIEYFVFVVSIARHIAQVLHIEIFRVFEPKVVKTQ